MELEELKRLMGNATAAGEQVPEMEAQLARANALRDTPAVNAAGTNLHSSPLSHIARIFNQIRGTDKAARVSGALTKAREQQAKAQTAGQIYGLETTAANRAEDVDWRKKKHAETEANKLKIAGLRAAAKKAKAKGTGAGTGTGTGPKASPTQYFNSETGENVWVVRHGDGFYDAGTNKEINFEHLEPIPEATNYTLVGQYHPLNSNDKVTVYRDQDNNHTDSAGNPIETLRGWTKVPPTSKVTTTVEDIFYTDPSAKERNKEVSESIKRTGQYRDILDLAKNLSPEQMETMNSPLEIGKGIAIDTLTTGGLKQLVKEWAIDMPAEGKAILSRLSRLSGHELHELFGAAFSPSEQDRADEFATFVKGKSLNDLMEAVVDRVNANVRSFINYDRQYKGTLYMDAFNRTRGEVQDKPEDFNKWPLAKQTAWYRKQNAIMRSGT